MAYKVTGDAVTVPKALSELKDNLGNVVGYDTVGQVYLKGSVIHDNDVSPTVQKLVKDGDPHTSSVLEYVGDSEEVNKLLAERDQAEQERYKAAAESGHLGPAPIDVGVTGPTGAPGVIDPAAAAEKSKLQQGAGMEVDPNVVSEEPLSEEADPALEQQGQSTPKAAKRGRPKKESKDSGSGSGEKEA